MHAVVFVLLSLVSVFLVLFRRLFRGPLHPGWSVRYEIITEVIRRSFQRGLSLSVQEMRHMPSARIYPSVKRLLVHSKGTLAGLPTEEFTPRASGDAGGTLLYFHRGGDIVGGPRTHPDPLSPLPS